MDLTTVNLGGNLYNYSDMTGSTLTAPPESGTWTIVHDTEKRRARLNISWTADTPDDGEVRVAIACSSDGVTFGPELPVVNGASRRVAACRYVKVITTFIRSCTGDSPVLYDLRIARAKGPAE